MDLYLNIKLVFIMEKLLPEKLGMLKKKSFLAAILLTPLQEYDPNAKTMEKTF
jgi:hypothetical protein